MEASAGTAWNGDTWPRQPHSNLAPQQDPALLVPQPGWSIPKAPGALSGSAVNWGEFSELQHTWAGPLHPYGATVPAPKIQPWHPQCPCQPPPEEVSNNASQVCASRGKLQQHEAALDCVTHLMTTGIIFTHKNPNLWKKQDSQSLNPTSNSHMINQTQVMKSGLQVSLVLEMLKKKIDSEISVSANPKWNPDNWCYPKAPSCKVQTVLMKYLNLIPR